MRGLIFFSLFLSAIGFRVHFSRTVVRPIHPLKMTEEPKFVPIEKGTIESAAAVTGGILGLILSGPIGGLILAAVTNYVSKKDNEAGEALRGFGKTVVEAVNFLKKVNSKWSLTQKVTNSLGSTIENISSNSDSETLVTVKKTVVQVVDKVKDLNKEYDLISKGKDVVVTAATVSDAALEKVDELNKKVRTLL
jgi:hypothetical protein